MTDSDVVRALRERLDELLGTAPTQKTFATRYTDWSWLARDAIAALEASQSAPAGVVRPVCSGCGNAFYAGHTCAAPPVAQAGELTVGRDPDGEPNMDIYLDQENYVAFSVSSNWHISYAGKADGVTHYGMAGDLSLGLLMFALLDKIARLRTEDASAGAPCCTSQKP